MSVFPRLYHGSVAQGFTEQKNHEIVKKAPETPAYFSLNRTMQIIFKQARQGRMRQRAYELSLQ